MDTQSIIPFSQLLEEFKSLNLPKNQYAIFGSGPLGVRGLRECHDIDTIVTKQLFNDKKYGGEWKFYDGSRNGRQFQYLRRGNIELWKDWGPGEWDILNLIQQAEEIQGIKFVRLEEVLKWKQTNVREKDIVDIELIKEYLKFES